MNFNEGVFGIFHLSGHYPDFPRDAGRSDVFMGGGRGGEGKSSLFGSWTFIISVVFGFLKYNLF